MEKAKEVIKKHENIFIIFFIILITIGYCFDVYLGRGDEIWNFQNICKMLNGYKIYTDANVITTPLFHFIGYVFLKLFGQNILVFRIYNLFIMIIMYFLIYKILGKLCKNKFSTFIYFCIMIMITKSIWAWNTYNKLAIDFVLLGVFLNLIWIEKKEKHNIIQAVIMFLVFFTKQNIGVFYILGICLYQIIKEKNIKNIIKQMIFFGIFLGISIILFMYFGIFNDFINYAVLGIGEFAKENIFGSIENIIQIIFSLIFVISMPIFLIKNEKIKNEEKDKLILLTTVSIPLMLIAFPIFDKWHTIVSCIVVNITLCYILDYILFKHILFGKVRKIMEILLLMYIFINMYLSIVHFYNYINNNLLKNNIFDYNHPFYGGFFSEKDGKEFEKVTKYIENSEEKVIILTLDAALYMIPLNRSNGAMDLPFLGNMGKNGEEHIIQKIKEMHNVKYLIQKDRKNMSWQESEKINNYIKENLEYLGEIEGYLIYLKK